MPVAILDACHGRQSYLPCLGGVVRAETFNYSSELHDLFKSYGHEKWEIEKGSICPVVDATQQKMRLTITYGMCKYA